MHSGSGNNHKDTLLLSEIQSEFEGSEEVKETPIPRVKVKAWMQSEDLEVLGAVYRLIMDKRFYFRIAPPLTIKDYVLFVSHYFGRCFREIPKESVVYKWAHSRHAAGCELAGWFASLWFDDGVPRILLLEIKNWLASFYKDGDEEIRSCIVTATLKPLFEEKKIAKFFADWRKDVILRRGYDEALKNSKGHLQQPAG